MVITVIVMRSYDYSHCHKLIWCSLLYIGSLQLVTKLILIVNVYCYGDFCYCYALV